MGRTVSRISDSAQRLDWYYRTDSHLRRGRAVGVDGVLRAHTVEDQDDEEEVELKLKEEEVGEED